MRRMNVRVAAVLTVPLLVLAGCGAAGDTGKKSTNGARETTGANTELRIAQPGEPRTLNLLKDSDSNATTFAYNVEETLTTKDQDNEIRPLLATKWETSDGAWIFHLRKGVKFQDGSDLTSADVVASFEAGIAGGMSGTVLADAKKVTAIDDLTVSVRFNLPDDPAVPNYVSSVPIVPEELASAPDDPLANKVVGTGPYKFVAWNRGTDVQLERNPDYWGKPGKFSKITMRFMTEDSARLYAVKAGEVDIALGLSPQLASQAPKLAAGSFSEVIGVRMRFFKGTPLADQRLREAINLAIDRDAILSGIMGKQAKLPKGQQVIPEVYGANAGLADWPHDPARAKQLVQEAGAVGKTITMSVPQGRFTKAREMGEAIVQMLSQVGIKVKASFDDPNKWGEKIFAKPAQMPDLLLINNSNDILDSAFTLNIYKCEGKYPGGCDPEFTEAVAAGNAAADKDKRAQEFARAWQIFRDNADFVSLAVPGQTHGIGKNVDWTPRLTPDLYFSDITIN
jgi:peptide/nickel transport system substrate-binding protein